MHTRQTKAVQILSCGNIHVIDRAARIFSVPSQRKTHFPYRVNLAAQSCECIDNHNFGFKCKHLRAAEMRERELNRLTAAPAFPRTFKNYDQLFAQYAR